MGRGAQRGRGLELLLLLLLPPFLCVRARVVSTTLCALLFFFASSVGLLKIHHVRHQATRPGCRARSLALSAFRVSCSFRLSLGLCVCVSGPNFAAVKAVFVAILWLG